MTLAGSKSANSKAFTERSMFSRSTAVTIDIKADPSVIWTLLTNASDYSRWTSTVISIEGKIAVGAKIQLRSSLDPKRVFKLKVREAIPGKTLVWGDAMGQRVYSISHKGAGTTFTMSEKIGGPLFSLFAKMIPPFDSSFEQFAADLEKEAETIMKEK